MYRVHDVQYVATTEGTCAGTTTLLSSASFWITGRQSRPGPGEVESRSIGIGNIVTFDQHDIRVLLYAIEHDLAVIGRHIEVTDDNVAIETSETTLRSRLEIDEPEVFVLDFPAQHNERVTSSPQRAEKNTKLFSDAERATLALTREMTRDIV